MSFESWAEFAAMGGYAPYVFGAYGITIAVGLGLVIHSLMQQSRWRQKQSQLQADTET